MFEIILIICGEKDELQLSMYYFEIPEMYKKVIGGVAIVAMVLLVVGVLVK